MVLYSAVFNFAQGKPENTWIADNPLELRADFDPDSAIGSTILVISTGDAYMKNSKNQWQKLGGSEVVL